MNNVKDALISAKFTSKIIVAYLKYVLPFSDMDETPAYITGHKISM